MRAARRLLVHAALSACALVAAAAAAAAEAPAIEDMRQRVLAQLDLRPGMRVAEIGVGGGWFVTRMAEAIGPRGIVYGTDIDAAAIAALQRTLPLGPSAARVELRLCRNGRDTALDDLPEGSLDLITMVDSLCFDGSEPRQRDVAYLSRFLRLLRPGGRLAEHMDCGCDVTTQGLIALVTDAGFSPQVELLDVSPALPIADANVRCRSETERQRHGLLAVFRKPGGDAGRQPAPAQTR